MLITVYKRSLNAYYDESKALVLEVSSFLTTMREIKYRLNFKVIFGRRLYEVEPILVIFIRYEAT